MENAAPTTFPLETNPPANAPDATGANRDPAFAERSIEGHLRARWQSLAGRDWPILAILASLALLAPGYAFVLLHQPDHSGQCFTCALGSILSGREDASADATRAGLGSLLLPGTAALCAIYLGTIATAAQDIQDRHVVASRGVWLALAAAALAIGVRMHSGT